MRLDHGGLMIADPDRSRAFYVGVLGLREVPRPPTFDFPGFWVQVGDQQLHLIGEAEPGRTSEVHPGYTRREVQTGYANHVAIVVKLVRGGRFFLEQLHRLTPAHVRAIFTAARPDKARKDAPAIDDWVAAFEDKVEQINAQRCQPAS